MLKSLVFSLAAVAVTSTLWSAAAPKFSLKTVDGKTFNLEEHIGKQVIVVDFWATWCGPCVKALKKMDEMKKEFPDVMVLAVSVDDSKTVSQVGPYVKNRGWNFTVLMDTDSNVCKMYNPSGSVPYTVVIDKKGEIVYNHSGYVPGDEVALKAKLEALKK